MKVALCLFACLSVALALPKPQEGGAFTNDAIKQAQQSNLIPAGAQIQAVSFDNNFLPIQSSKHFIT